MVWKLLIWCRPSKALPHRCHHARLLSSSTPLRMRQVNRLIHSTSVLPPRASGRYIDVSSSLAHRLKPFGEPWPCQYVRSTLSVQVLSCPSSVGSLKSSSH